MTRPGQPMSPETPTKAELTRERDKWHDVAWNLAQRCEAEGFRHLDIIVNQTSVDNEASILICDTEAAWEEMHRTDSP